MLAVDQTPTYVVVAIAIFTTLFASVTAPLLLARRMDQRHREDRLMDYARQDKVAAAAAQTAAVLEANTERTHQQLDEIHTAVNSNLTAATLSARDALVGQLATMRRLIPDPTAAESEQMTQIGATIAELTQTLKERGIPPAHTPPTT